MLVILQGLGDPQQLIGQGYASGGGVLRYAGVAAQASPTTVHFVVNATAAMLGADPAVTVAAGDTLSIDLLVELA